MGNPISLMRNYRNNVVNRLPQIRILDDIPICDRDQEHKNEITAITPSADVLFKVGKVRNLPMPSRADDQRHSQSAMPDECFFAIRFSFLGNGDSNSIISDDKKYSSEVDFEFEKIVTFDISEKLRDSLQRNTPNHCSEKV
ncbi:hypothetical protein BKA69DRAFT_541867 [Paraphysoderma sedebokerense]|nr:hypothetical protein BKA69DRAFT_541867 [Paraphysoderma sedebokerense]